MHRSLDEWRGGRGRAIVRTMKGEEIADVVAGYGWSDEAATIWRGWRSGMGSVGWGWGKWQA